LKWGKIKKLKLIEAAKVKLYENIEMDINTTADGVNI
jgi:hypothetical protein